MAEILEYKEGKVHANDEFRTLPIVKKFYNGDKSQNKKDFYNFITYLYFVYSPKSIYKLTLPYARKLIVCKDRLSEDAEYIDKIQDNDITADIIMWYVDRVKNSEEQLLDAVLVKIEQFIKFVHDFEITKDNHDEYNNIMKTANSLLDYQDKIRARVFKESSKKGQGGSTDTFLEKKFNRTNV